MEVEGEAVVLVDLRAGQMSMQAGGVLAADPRKGLLRVSKGEDTLTHVQWYERQGATPIGEPQLDTVVFPGECSLQQIPGQPRCYVLKFPEDNSRDVFFWMQQVKPDDDGPLIACFNAAVNDQELPPLPGAAPAQPAATPAPAAANSLIAQSLAAALQQATGAGSSHGAPASGVAGGGAAADPNALAMSLLSQLAAQQGRRVRVPVDEGPGLHEVLKPELLIPAVQQLLPSGLMERLAPHLPEEHRSQEALIATLRSPQFQQQVATFSAALQTGQLDVAQFGLNAKGFSVADFLEAVQEAADKEKQQQ